jgi:chemotaxis protein MotA
VDIGSLLGIVICGIVVVMGIITSVGGFELIGDAVMFIDPASLIITFGGTLFCVLTSVPLQDFLAGFKSFTLIFKKANIDTSGIIQKIIELSNIARKEGLLQLEEAATDLEDAFLKKGVLLIVDGTDPDLVRAILETELYSIENRHKKITTFWDTMASMGPAWGMIGTLIGLVAMLKNMDDPSTIGSAMATAVLTTLYGAVLANWIATPVSNKLKAQNGEEMMSKEIMIEGLLSIQAGENPRVIEEKLKSFLSPKLRNDSADAQVEGGE